MGIWCDILAESWRYVELCKITWMNSNDMAMSLDIISIASKVKSRIFVMFFTIMDVNYEGLWQYPDFALLGADS